MNDVGVHTLEARAYIEDYPAIGYFETVTEMTLTVLTCLDTSMDRRDVGFLNYYRQDLLDTSAPIITEVGGDPTLVQLYLGNLTDTYSLEYADQTPSG